MASILRLVVALFLTLTSFVTAQDTEIPLVCHDGVQIIAVVGANITNGTQSYGLTVTFVEDVMKAIPDSGNFSVNYNRFPGNQSTAVTFIPEVEEGVPALLAAIKNYTTACPDTPVVLHGYSEGAVVVMNLLCGASSGSFPVTSPLASSYANHIISVILYGDESRTANLTYDLGTCTANALHLSRRTPSGCDAFVPSIRSYCNSNDIDCCGTANASAPWPNNINPHWVYPAQYDLNATDWTVSRYSSYISGTTSTSSSSTSSKTSTTSSTSSKTSSSTTSSKSSSSTTSSKSSSSTTSSKSSSSTTSSKSSSSTTSSKPSSTSSSSSSTSTSTSSKPSSTSTSTTSTSSTTATTPTSTPTTTSTTASSTLTTTTSTTATTKSHFSISPTCTMNKCLSSFWAHPTKASHFCSELSAGSATGTPYPTVCSPNYAANIVSACSCLQFNGTSTAA